MTVYNALPQVAVSMLRRLRCLMRDPTVRSITRAERENMMSTVYMFDVDGTLTEARQPMSRNFADYFLQFCQDQIVYLVTGSDKSKVDEQVPVAVQAEVEGIFTCNAAEYWVENALEQQITHDFPVALVDALNSFVSNSSFTVRTGCHIERRTGMINVSSVGRNATTAERAAYHAWDQNNRERLQFIRQFEREFPGYRATIGGEISIDIAPCDLSKALALVRVRECYPAATIRFFGDRAYPGGNDWPLAQALTMESAVNTIHKVDGYKDTLSKLRSLDRRKRVDYGCLSALPVW